MKIAFFADNFYPELSGIADTILLTGSELARRGHEVHCFVPVYSRKNYEMAQVPYGELAYEKNFHVRRMFSLPYVTPTRQGRAMIPYLLRGVTSRERFDVVHTHSFFGPGLDALVFSRIKNIPLIGTNHTLIEEFTRHSPIRGEWFGRLMRSYVIWYYNHCRSISVPSQFLANHMLRYGLRRPASVVSNPIAQEFFIPGDRESLKREFGFKPFTILYAGRLSPEKGVDILLRAFVSFAEHTPEAGLVFVGQGSLRPFLEKEAAATRVSGQIKFMGPFLGERKKTLYDIFRASDISATASTSETQCMSIMQAMAAGLPPVGTRAGALPEYISVERGFLFEPGGAEELARHLNALFVDPALRKNMGRESASFAPAFSVPAIADIWEDLYRSAIQARR